MIDQQLMKYFKFDQADLTANQSGQFTENQKARLVQEDKSGRKWGLIGGSVLVLIGLGGLIGAITAIMADHDLGFVIGFGLGFGCIWPLVWGGLGYVVVQNALTKHQFKLAEVQGRANIVRRESYSSSSHSTNIYHELHIGGKEFSVREDLADVLMQGEEYKLYYVDGSSEILSAEAMGTAK